MFEVVFRDVDGKQRRRARVLRPRIELWRHRPDQHHIGPDMGKRKRSREPDGPGPDHGHIAARHGARSTRCFVHGGTPNPAPREQAQQ